MVKSSAHFMLALIGLFGVSACSAIPTTSSEIIRHGNALGQDGFSRNGTVGLSRVKDGDDIVVALPVPRNRASETVRMQRVRLMGMPDGIRVLSYYVVREADTGGRLAIWNARTSALDFDPRQVPRGEVSEIRLEADKSLRHAYVVAHLRVENSPPFQFGRRVRYYYTMGGDRYYQDLRASYELVQNRGRP